MKTTNQTNEKKKGITVGNIMRWSLIIFVTLCMISASVIKANAAEPNRKHRKHMRQYSRCELVGVSKIVKRKFPKQLKSAVQKETAKAHTQSAFDKSLHTIGKVSGSSAALVLPRIF